MLTGQCTFPELQSLETRFGDLSLVENRHCASDMCRWRRACPGTYQSSSHSSALEANSSNDRAQFTLTVTAVVAMIEPLEPVRGGALSGSKDPPANYPETAMRFGAFDAYLCEDTAAAKMAADPRHAHPNRAFFGTS